jgi:hypothetical protein
MWTDTRAAPSRCTPLRAIFLASHFLRPSSSSGWYVDVLCTTTRFGFIPTRFSYRGRACTRPELPIPLPRSSNANGLCWRVLAGADVNCHAISNTWLAHGFLSSSPPTHSAVSPRHVQTERNVPTFPAPSDWKSRARDKNVVWRTIDVHTNKIGRGLASSAASGIGSACRTQSLDCEFGYSNSAACGEPH